MAPLSERDRESVSLFVDEMKAAREQRKWSQAELGRQAGYSESAIAMVESFQRPPTTSLATALDKAFGAPGTFARLERRLRDLPFPAAFRSFVPYEAEAATLRMFQHSLVPGLLQTPRVRAGRAGEGAQRQRRNDRRVREGPPGAPVGAHQG